MLRLLAGRTASGGYRDTDADWRKIGSDEPYYGVLTDPRFLRANLDEQARSEFFQSGVDQITDHLLHLNRHFGEFSPRSALDFGCGVGRLTRALAAQTGDAVGVDISEGMIHEARSATLPGLRFQHELPDRDFDWIVSIIVFQHIEPTRGYQVLRQLLSKLVPGGCVTLQFALYRDAKFHHTAGARVDVNTGSSLSSNGKKRALPVGEILMFDYDLSIIAAALFEAGVEDLNIRHTDHGGFHGAYVYGRKRAAT